MSDQEEDLKSDMSPYSDNKTQTISNNDSVSQGQSMIATDK